MLNSSLFSISKANNIAKGLARTSKFSFNGIITNLEKTVSTINQVIPLYTQVKPLINNSKTIFSTASKYFKRKNISSNNYTRNNNVINVEIKETTNQNKKEDFSSFINTNKPNKPFFI